MADVQRSQSTLLTSLFQDGQSEGISAQDMRDLIVSLTPSFGGYSFTTPATTTISTSGTYVKAAGTTTLTGSSADVDDNSVSNRLRYTGASPRRFQVSLQASLTLAAGSNQDCSIEIYQYDDSASSGSLVTHSQAHTTIPGTDIVNVASHADLLLDTNDYIEMHITNNTATNNIEVSYGYVFMHSLLV